MPTYNVKSSFYKKDRTTPWDLLLWTAEGYGPYRTVCELAHSIANSKGAVPSNYKLAGVVQGKPFSFQKYSYTLDGINKGYVHQVFEEAGLNMSSAVFDELKLEMELSKVQKIQIQIKPIAEPEPEPEPNPDDSDDSDNSDDGESIFDLFG